jgi:radical SAM superfamily enzyme YgiQ (UPF0313 family)
VAPVWRSVLRHDTPLKIFLADLTHKTVVLVSDTIPINIGFLAAYAKKIHGDRIDIELFKYPDELIAALKRTPPDILALSNYSWNSNLSERIAGLAKQINPGVLTVQGGPNFPGDCEQQLDFLLSRPMTDTYIELEGEIVFSSLVARVLAARDGGPAVLSSPVDGCVFVDPATRNSAQSRLVKGKLPDRIRELDDIPSPYLTGLLDKFFDGKLRPFLETNRGCPFQCTFCHTGDKYFQKINMFSIERIRDEIEYIAPRISKLGIAGLHIADTNFGMFPRDRDICEALKSAHDTCSWPKQVIATTGKNNKERVMEITSLMGTIFNVNMSVQSMDETVLRNIKRSNIKLEDYVAVGEHLKKQGRPGFGELILGLPGETKESFIRGLKQVIEAGVSAVTVYTLMLLYGTQFRNPEYRKKYGIKGMFRIVPLNFGDYEGQRVFDYEEVGVETVDMSFDDYLYLRGVSLMVETLHNGRPFEELFRYALLFGESRSDMLMRVYESLAKAPQRVRDLVAAFKTETKGELWESEAELLAFYREDDNYQRLVRGEAGGNLLQKYKSSGLAFANQEWISFIAEVCLDLARERLRSAEDLARAEEEISVLRQFCQRKLEGLLDISGNVGPTFFESKYDVVTWLKEGEGASLSDYAVKNTIQYEFVYSDEQITVRDEYFRRYGSDANGLSKIVTRISSLESMIRRIRTADGAETLYADAKRNLSSRYAMST